MFLNRVFVVKLSWSSPTFSFCLIFFTKELYQLLRVAWYKKTFNTGTLATHHMHSLIEIAQMLWSLSKLQGCDPTIHNLWFNTIRYWFISFYSFPFSRPKYFRSNLVHLSRYLRPSQTIITALFYALQPLISQLHCLRTARVFETVQTLCAKSSIQYKNAQQQDLSLWKQVTILAPVWVPQRIVWWN